MGNSSTSFRRPAALLLFAASLGLVVMASCENLPNVEANVCGNRVVEPLNGEDCDGYPGREDLADAGDAGDAGDASNALSVTKDEHLCSAACRYVCNVAEAPSVVCPDGFGCGIDGTCHKPGGLSLPALSIAGGGVRRLLGGDFDGDGRQDAVALGDSALEILFFETNGLIDRSITVPNDRRLPGIGDIDGDGTSDLVLNLGDALGVLLGQDNRTLLPRSYHSGDVDGGTKRIVPIGLVGPDNNKKNTLLAFVTTMDEETVLHTVVVEGTTAEPPKLVASAPLPGTLDSAVAVSRNTKLPTKCPVVAFALKSKSESDISKVYLLSCGESAELALEPKITEIPLGMGESPWEGVFFADADGDGDDDLLVGINEPTSSLHVYLNDGTGTFAKLDAPPSHLAPIHSEKGNCGGRVLASAPLAVGDIDDNGALDVVDERGVLYNPYQVPPGPDGGYSKDCLQDPKLTWKNAVIGDFNGDLRPDVLASRRAQTLLDMWSLVEGGELHTFTVAVEEPVGEIARGDFDGDSVDDAILRLAPPVPPAPPGAPEKTLPTELLVLFGRPLAAPDPPLSLGIFENLKHIAAGRLKGKNAVGSPDLLDDLVVLSSATQAEGEMPGMPGMEAPASNKHFTIVEGNVGRRLLAPLSLKGKSARGTDDMTIVADQAPTQIVVSRFAVNACAAPPPLDETVASVTPSTIVARTGDDVWLAGCQQDGSSLRIVDGANAGDVGMLIAGVNYEPANAKDGDEDEEALAFFVEASLGGPGLWVHEYKGGQFNLPPANIPRVELDLALPESEPFDVPSLVVDVDGDGWRDVVVLKQKIVDRVTEPSRSGVVVFWNAGKDTETVDEKKENRTVVDFSDAYLGPDTMDSSADTEGLQGIVDIAFLNIDDTRAKELVVLTRTGLYVLHLVVAKDKTRSFGPPELFTRVRGGEALLALDANSDGVDDLLVAEGQKLLLFLGKEAAR